MEKLNFVNQFPRAAATGLRLPLRQRLLVERRGREDLGGSRLAALESARVGALAARGSDTQRLARRPKSLSAPFLCQIYLQPPHPPPLSPSHPPHPQTPPTSRLNWKITL